MHSRQCLVLIVGAVIIYLIHSYFDLGKVFNPYHSSQNERIINKRLLRQRHHRRDIGEKNSTGLYILPIPTTRPFLIDEPWANVKMPTSSVFRGFSPPINETQWEIAKLQASRGEQILLQRILETIKSPTELVPGDSHFRWVHRLVDVFVTRDNGATGLMEVKSYRGPRAPIVQLGMRKFDRPNFEGHSQGFNGFGPDNVLRDSNFIIPRKIVAIGLMDENWGWLSTYIHNRTVSWAVTLARNNGLKDLHKVEELSGMTVMGKFLNDPNLLALIVNQHHNFTHEKVLSFPLGIRDRAEVWDAVLKVERLGLKKETTFFSASSGWGPRPQTLECIRKKMGDEISATTTKMSPSQYRVKLATSRVALCMSGLGYDTYKLWETLASGVVPVIERGIGLDRTLWKLPALIVDDFADLTPELVRVAYVEALYRADEWEYERITQRWWERLVFQISEAGSIEPLAKLHPMKAVDVDFARPIWPYDCTKGNGCAVGTKRTPKESCLINYNVPLDTYPWHIWA